MNYFLDLAFSLLTTPKKAMLYITGEEKWKEGFLFWIFVVFLTALSAFQEGPGLVLQFVLVVLFMGFSLLIHSAVTDYLAGLWGGLGTARGITAGFMAGSLPMAFSVFFSFLDVVGASFLSGIGTFVIWGWAFYLDVLAISTNYRFGTGKSFLLALAPYLLVGFFFIILAILMVLAAAIGISSMESLSDMEAMMNQI